MFKTFFVIFVNVLLVYTQEECRNSPFQNTWVRIYKNETVNTEDQRIKSCITPQTITGYKENRLLGIKITNQNIPNINKGSIAHIQDNFSITMEGNKIDRIKEEAFLNLGGVKAISLISNGISWIEAKAFSNLPSLTYVNLENNQIRDLPHSAFYNLPKLERLDLSYNNLFRVKNDWFNRIPNLKVLEIAYNHITIIAEDTFQNLPALEYLNLYRNQIETVHKRGFIGLNGLNTLNLGSNKVSSFDADFSSSPKLILLHLENNYMNYVADEVLESLRSLKKLVLHSNPMQCSCYDKINKWASQRKVFITWKCNNDNPVCVIPTRKSEECYHRQEQDYYASLEMFQKRLKNCSF